MRTLFYVPMIHSDKELSDVGLILRDLETKFHGGEAATHDEAQIDQLWRTIRSWALQTVGDIRGLVIYEDGMPVGPREKVHALFKLVLAEHPDSPLFCFTKELLDAGAVLEGTEDITLVVKRATIYREISQAATRYSTLEELKDFLIKKVKEQDDLILKADTFIARRINETLPENGRGILFMGHRHRVEEELVKMREDGLLSTPIEIRELKLYGGTRNGRDVNA